MPYPTRCITLGKLNAAPHRIFWHYHSKVEHSTLCQIVEEALDEMFHKAEARDIARDGAAAVLAAVVECDAPKDRYSQRKAWAANLDYLFPGWFRVQQSPLTQPA